MAEQKRTEVNKNSTSYTSVVSPQKKKKKNKKRRKIKKGSGARLMIHMKCQDLFSLKNKKKFRVLSATNFAWHFKS